MRFRELLSAHKFYKTYAEHIVDIYYLIVLSTSIALFFSIMSFKMTETYYFLLVYIGVFFVHRVLLWKIANKELFPHEILTHEKLLFRAYVFSSVSIILVLVAIPLFSYFSIFKFFTQSIGILLMLFMLAFSFLLLSVIYSVMPPYLSSFRKTRLCLRVVSDALSQLPNERHQRIDFVKNYIKWFGEGLHSYNRYLFRKRRGLQIKNIDDYHNIVYMIALIGNPDEVKNKNEQVRMALKSLSKKEGEDSLRDFLISLQHIGWKENVKFPDLTSMTKTMPLSEMVIKILTRYVVPISASITLFYHVWEITSKAL